MDIRHKLLLLVLFLALILGSALSYLYQSQQKALAMLARNESQSRLLLVKQIISLHGQSIHNMVADYTFWDEMVSFVDQPAPDWAEENLESALETYGLGYVGVFTPDGKTAYSLKQADIAALDPHLPNLPLNEMFQRDNLPRFFLTTETGLLECFAATIHPSDDAERTSPSRGFFFVARRWNSELLTDLAELTQSELEVAPYPKQNVSPFSHVDENGLVELSVPLSGPENSPAAHLKVTVRSAYIRSIHLSAREIFAAMTVGILFTLIVLYWKLHSWVRKPLRTLALALEKDSPEHLSKLERRDNEFAHLATLFKAFLEQHEELREEGDKHAAARKALEVSETKFNKIFTHIPVGLIALDHELRILHANHEILKLFGYTLCDLEGEHVSNLIHPDDLDPSLDSLTEMVRGEKAFHRSAQRFLDRQGNIIAASKTDICIHSDNECLCLVSMIVPAGHDH